MIDYHIHTSLCNHAQGKMEEYVLAGIEKGLIEICFLDHLILHNAGRNSSMTLDEVSLYFSEAKRLGAIYKDKIAVKVGLEVDFDPENIDRVKKLIGQYDFDVIGSSIHFIDGVNIASRREGYKTSEKIHESLANKYFLTLRNMLDYDYFDFICHFDVIKKTGRKIPDENNQIINDIIKITAKKNIAVEVNTGGFQHPVSDSYPSQAIIQKCIEANIPLLLSSDAHKPSDVGNHFKKTIKMLSTLGCEKICSYNKRKISFTRIAAL